MLIWYLARGAGISAFLLLSLATAVGATIGRRWRDPQSRIQWQYVHRAAALGGVTMVLLHVGTLLADSYANVGVRGLLPFGSGYRPVAVTLGVLAAYLLVAVSVTGALRSRLASSPRAVRIWRGIHLTSYAAWASSALHFYLAGTDRGETWALAVLFAGIGAVLAGVMARLFDRRLVTIRATAPAGAVTPQTRRLQEAQR
jgi:methionine sulfoxide reductase heme-binding subunit